MAAATIAITGSHDRGPATSMASVTPRRAESAIPTMAPLATPAAMSSASDSRAVPDTTAWSMRSRTPESSAPPGRNWMRLAAMSSPTSTPKPRRAVSAARTVAAAVPSRSEKNGGVPLRFIQRTTGCTMSAMTNVAAASIGAPPSRIASAPDEMAGARNASQSGPWRTSCSIPVSADSAPSRSRSPEDTRRRNDATSESRVKSDVRSLAICTMVVGLKSPGST